ncbi:hypothetical protein FHS83_002638 [Rhizomicrobium palustre]|uniref:Aspartyl protease n=1 Tax=Rhizomicrobium palustre TaxID=189966 RepID=A0A846N2J9_9PROT|nr:retropepsin-like aspartic protease [Rhizomicrobium palustre]NIK89320.1 hypothetical protein [Rhizomicrobium palustre]
MRKIVMAVLALAAATGTASAASDCKPTLTASFPMVHEPSGAVAATVEIDGAPHNMLIDVSSMNSFITQGFADSEKLTKRIINRQVTITTEFGMAKDYAFVRSLKLGHAEGGRMEMIVLPGNFRDPELVGSLGMDILGNFGIEFDFAAAKINLLGGCTDIGGYWAKQYAEVPFETKTLKKPMASFTLDGQPVNVTFSTVDQGSEISFRVAHDKFGLSKDSPGVKTVPASEKPIYLYRFKELAAEGGVKVNNPLMRLKGEPDDARCDGHEHFGHQGGGTVLITCYSFGDVRLGLKALSQLHLYFDFPNKKLALTAADAH